MSDVHPASKASRELAKIEKLAPASHAGDSRDQKVEMRPVVREIETLAVHDQERRLIVPVEKAGVRVCETGEIRLRHLALELDAAPMHALDQGGDRRLQVNDQFGRGRLRFQMAVDLVVEREFRRRKEQPTGSTPGDRQRTAQA